MDHALDAQTAGNASRSAAISSRFALKVLGLAALVSLAINGSFVAGHALAVAPWGFPDLLLIADMALGLSVLVTLGLWVAGVGVSIGCRDLRLLLVACVWTVLHAPLTVWALPAGMKLRSDAFADLAERSQPLVVAVHRFEADHGRPPQSLDELVPLYLKEIPPTGMAAYRQYTYTAGDDARKWFAGNNWVLRIECSSGILNWDWFFYLPGQNYADLPFSGVERVGEWGYLHE